MKQSKAEIILHPVRMKIIQALAKKSMTVLNMLDYLGDVPQATLYRHLNQLTKFEIIYVEEERKRRGTVEKTYALNEKNAIINAKEAGKISKDDHFNYFMTYYAMILKQLEEYMEGEVNFEKDGFGYHQVEMCLSEEDFQQFSSEYRDLLVRFSKLNSDSARKRSLSTVIIPEKKEKKDGESNE
ncbi:transcriptional regulator [Salipaludibacillus neizhouensis]|uniref:Transcriptional regulator n=1 Tax=Salipaludibacillus neizhouensis TaxID=885475 RepID=A0A3A9JXQ8_9BACI|nr:helix-turn-helix domain-containing protein [Salipaludibacillus neizhouensis]RKL64989.1 transcriptional regulator [Salipaludibacillus neizhouensis]